MFSTMNRLLLIGCLVLTISNFLTSALKIASRTTTIEYTPELIATQDYYTGSTQIINAGVESIVSDRSIDLASNAETQALRQYATHKNLRIIYTVAEVTYRLVANKKSGISSLSDLKGKRVGTMQGTSAAYFIQKYLASAGLKDSDYTVVGGNMCMSAPCGAGTLPYMVTHGSIDAVGFWEPTGELTIEALGSNAVVFQDRSVYREIFNLHSTAEKLKDPTTRKSIVEFIRALNKAEAVFTTDPESVYPRVAKAVNMDTTLLKAVWPIHRFNGTIPSDLLDVLVEEDKWVAKQDRRNAMTRDDLSNLIDSSVFEEALQT